MAVPFKPAAVKKNATAGPTGTATTTATGKRSASFPEIQKIDKALALPSIAGRGVSGSGKTTAIAHLLEAGKNLLVVDFENKFQSLLKYDPMVLPLGAPMVDPATGAKRPPSWRDLFDRLWEFADRLGSGEFREWKGRPIEIIAGDGFMEVCKIIERYQRMNVPVSKTTGERNTFAAYQEIGDKATDFLMAIKSAASAASQMYGMPPVGMYWTVGENRVTSKMGEISYPLALPGNLTPQAFPFQFEAIFRMSVRRDTDGRALYVLQTVGEEGVFEAKCPGGVLEPEEFNWNFNTIYDRITDWYRASVVQRTEETK